MFIKKLSSLLLIVTMILLLPGCAKDINVAITKDRDILETPIIHNVYNYTGETKGDVVSIFNSNGDVKVTKSDTSDLKVVVNLIQTKQIKEDIDQKLNSLVIEPKIQNGVIFYEPLYAADTTRNYWDWIKSNLNANGICVNFEVQIPSTIKEVRVYNELGNINLQNITTKIYAQTNIGNITGDNLDPLDSAVFKVNIPSSGDTGLDVKFSSIDKANDITTGVMLGNIVLNLPSSANYSHKEAQLEDIPLKYPYDMYSKDQFEYCRKAGLEKFEPINSKTDKTNITTVIGKKNLYSASINDK